MGSSVGNGPNVDIERMKAAPHLQHLPHPYLAVSPHSRSFDRWQTNDESTTLACSPVILTQKRLSRFLRPHAEDEAETKPPEDPIVSCQHKMDKLKALLKMRQTTRSDSNRNDHGVIDIHNSNGAADLCPRIDPPVDVEIRIPPSCDSLRQIYPDSSYEAELDRESKMETRAKKSNKKLKKGKRGDRPRRATNKDQNRSNSTDRSKKIKKWKCKQKCEDAEAIGPPAETAPPPEAKVDPKKYNDKGHHRKQPRRQAKVRHASPIYFCPDTARLYKKPHHPKKSTADVWSVNTLVEKYVSFLKNAGCRRQRTRSETDASTDFDETKGKFVDTSPHDEAFTIVLKDKPKARSSSDCESEDSFVICFESDCETNVFTGDDAFDNSWTSDDEEEGGDEEVEEERLKSCMRKPRSRAASPKKVTFVTGPPKVHKMIAWKFAYHQARIGPWQGYARDAQRFKQRITDLSVALDWVLKREHRNRIFFQRFRPILMRQAREEREAKAKELERLRTEQQQQQQSKAEEFAACKEASEPIHVK